MPVKSTMSPLLRSQLLGCSEEHILELPGHFGVRMHQSVIQPLQQLIKASQDEGFDLRVASGFRSFDRQLLIWNKKCRGERPVYDKQGHEIDIQQCSGVEKIWAILHWSALPGTSRHHWGTDCDIYDAAAIPAGYQLQLHSDEYTVNGLFAPMMEWLSEYLQESHAPDFYRPYMDGSSGIATELWHLSYRPVASRYEQQFSLSLLREYLEQLPEHQAIEEQEVLLDNLESIYDNFIKLKTPIN